MKNNLPRGGGVQIAQDIKKETTFIDPHSGSIINNLKEKRVVGTLKEASEITPQEIAEVIKNHS